MVQVKTTTKYVYYFGGGKADGNESMKNLLGGKGANLAEMAGHAKLRLPFRRAIPLQQKCVPLL
jgi:pyruvate,orthophosphate dikinase